MRGDGVLRVAVRLFAGYRERAGVAQVELELPQGATVGDLASEMVRRYPPMTREASRLVVAVNQEYQEHDHVLSGGDEVALIPPVSGGIQTDDTPMTNGVGKTRATSPTQSSGVRL